MLVAVFLLGGCSVKATFERQDTDGWARGVAEAGGFVYLADGLSGLKIYEVAIGKPNLTGSLALPGLNTRVAVDGNIAWLNDLDSAVLYAVDVSDPFKPKKKAQWSAPGAVTALEAADGVAYLAIPFPNSGSGAGLYAVKLSGDSVQALGNVALAGIADIALTSSHVWVIDATRILSFARSSSSLSTTPISTLTVKTGENLQSLDSGAAPWLVALGHEIWVINGANAKAPAVASHQKVPGATLPRYVAASNLVTTIWRGEPLKIFLFQPVIFKSFNIAYSTGAEYGRGLADGSQGKIFRLDMVYDVDKESDGKARLFEITFRDPIQVPWSQGGTALYGGLDNHGLVWEFWTPASASPTP